MAFPFGETLTIHRASTATQDGDGNDVQGYEDATSSGWAIAPGGATEIVQGRDQLITGLTAVTNEQVEVSGVDRVTIETGPYAGNWNLDGMPGAFVSALTGRCVTTLNLTKVTG